MLPHSLRPAVQATRTSQRASALKTLCRRYNASASTNSNRRHFNEGYSRRGRIIAATSTVTGLMVLLGLTGLPANSKLAYHTSGQSTLLPDAVGSAGLSNVEEPLSHLVRRYIVYTMCSIPGLVEVSPQILDVLLKIPGLRSMTEAVVRVTFFDQFVGGDTVQDMLPVLQSLRSTNKGAICVYSVEENPNAENSSQTSDNAPHKRVVEEMLRAIDVAGDFEDSVSGKYVLDGSNDAPVGRRTWVAVKLTALLPSTKPLHHLSAYLLATRPESNNSEPVVSYPGCAHQSDLDVLFTKPTSSSSSSSDSNSNSKSKSRPHLTLTHSDILLLRDLHTDLRRICLKAEKRGVKVVIDAEYSWFQPAMDAFQIALMREFNRSSESLDSTSNGDSGEGEEMRGRVQPLVYGTYQAYLRRTLTQLTHDLADSREHGYALGVKLVRGAYHPYEIKAHQKRHKAIQPQEGLSSSSKDSDEKSSSLSLSNETLPPVWQTKKETDECFDDCVRMLIGRVAEDVQQSQNQNQNQATVQGKSSPTTPATATRIGVLFGTHNWTSSKLVLGELVRLGLVSGVHHHGTTRSTSNDNDNGSSKRIVIDVDDNRNRYQDKYGSTTNEDSDEDNRVLTIPASVADRVCMGHLYGMNDVLSDYIVKRTKSEEGVPPVPMVVKYIPYGALSQVMPYLGRRAIENQSVLGNENAAEERRRAGREIWRRVFGR